MPHDTLNGAHPSQAHSPAPGSLNIDHVAHFVPHIDEVRTVLERLGFTVTPFSAQSHRLHPGGPLTPAGTGNRCVMLKQGYLEFLTPTGDTPVADQLRNAIKRYTGVHLVAFGTASPDVDRARLAKAGFDPLDPVALQREIGIATGADTARFTVVRVPPGTMAEGRIQFCQHHTPEFLWQPRWLEHANRVSALTAVLLCVADPQEAARRYARFTGLHAHVTDGQWRIDTARGRMIFLDAATTERALGLAPPALPWIAGYVLAADAPAARARCAAAGLPVRDLEVDRFSVVLPPELGGVIVFEAPHAAAPHFAGYGR